MAQHESQYDVIVVGGGQSGLAVGYHLRKTGLNFLILDDQEHPGGAWRHGWDSLTLFSAAEHSSLPGWLMPPAEGEYPSRDHVIDYLSQYERRYKLPVKRPVNVSGVAIGEGGRFVLDTSVGEFACQALVSATGTWKKPYVPDVPGLEAYTGVQLHSAQYREPYELAGKEVLIVGGGNSGAQIVAEVSKYAITTWSTLKPPTFLPDEIDGKYLFDVSSKAYNAHKEGRPYQRPKASLADVVMVPSVKEARERGALKAVGPIEKLTPDGAQWPDGTHKEFDAIIWCTGFKPAVSYLEKIKTDSGNGRLKTRLTRAEDVPGLWLVGYGSWTGFASATLIGVGRTARQTVSDVQAYIKASRKSPAFS